MSIRAIVISDLHLGASNSILTEASLGGAPGVGSEPLDMLAACLRDLAGNDRPQLIVNGDLLEMALATMKQSTLVFDRFLSQLFDRSAWPFADELVFLAGNHDHHLWEGAREVWYRHQLRSASALADMPDTPHVTDVFGRIDGSAKPHVSEPVSQSKAATSQKNKGGLSWKKSPPAVGSSHCWCASMSRAISAYTGSSAGQGLRRPMPAPITTSAASTRRVRSPRAPDLTTGVI